MLGWLTDIQIPRCIGGSTGVEYLLCGFSDASEKGYAAVLYLRVTDPSQKITVYLLGEKTKLAPLKPTTIPRLELCGSCLVGFLAVKNASDTRSAPDDFRCFCLV